ncbi:MAG: DUF1573 domain-containing protein [Bacteroidales bacterium]|jgi:hypothetical protein|nr:DUF1573 domain-containing protein [Bacteroidales bacterium]
MKKLFLFGISLLLVSGLAAQAPAKKVKEAKVQTEQTKEPLREEPKKAGTEPEITFETLVYDYGTIYKGDSGECEFKYKNTGKEDLIVSAAHASCGCTIPSFTNEPVPYKKDGVIKVKYNTQNVGIINKTITVESNAVNNRVTLQIKGQVIERPAEAAPADNASPMVAPQR